jgi:hypothetical protein
LLARQAVEHPFQKVLTGAGLVVGQPVLEIKDRGLAERRLIYFLQAKSHAGFQVKVDMPQELLVAPAAAVF